MRWGQGAALSGVSNAMSSLTHAVKLKAGMVKEKRLVFAGIDAAGRESPPRNSAAVLLDVGPRSLLLRVALLRSMNRSLVVAAVTSWMLDHNRLLY